eukprot:403361090
MHRSNSTSKENDEIQLIQQQNIMTSGYGGSIRNFTGLDSKVQAPFQSRDVNKKSKEEIEYGGCST